MLDKMGGHLPLQGPFAWGDRRCRQSRQTKQAESEEGIGGRQLREANRRDDEQHGFHDHLQESGNIARLAPEQTTAAKEDPIGEE